jgi:hypothetical protein
MDDLAAVHQTMDYVVVYQAVEDTQVEVPQTVGVIKVEAVVQILKVFIIMKFQKQYQAVTEVYQQTPAQMEMALLN